MELAAHGTVTVTHHVHRPIDFERDVSAKTGSSQHHVPPEVGTPEGPAGFMALVWNDADLTRESFRRDTLVAAIKNRRARSTVS